MQFRSQPEDRVAYSREAERPMPEVSKTPPSDSNTAENRSSSERWSAQYWREPWEPISSEVQPTQRTVRSGRMLSRSERSSLLFEPTFEKLS